MSSNPSAKSERARPARKAPEAAQPYHHGALHAALLAAAQDILESQGLAALTLRAAARAAGVSHAAPKNHFGDLTGLLSELAALGFREFADALRGAARESQGSPADRFDAIGHAYVRFARERTAMFLLMFRSERLDMHRPALSEAVDEARAALAGATASRMGRDPAHAPDATQSARMVAAWSLVHGFSMLLIDHRLDTLLSQRPGGPDWQLLLRDVFGAPRGPGLVTP
ncbi:TetR/AcrR family transcriptional regulator [Variovorax sp. OV329]|uniref:TetR/AcrR family transcriptional regulator n=1 Tax=Variovorax sp. OV329 TaxID=1882825 RepID=UPI001587E1EE|nr:TetR-like C-terminal domain-containing protein [Variovorax sp. OV329]